MSNLLGRVQTTERHLRDVHLVCNSCSGLAPGEPILCESLDCPWLFERQKIYGKVEHLTTIHDLLNDLEAEWSEASGHNLAGRMEVITIKEEEDEDDPENVDLWTYGLSDSEESESM